MKVVYFPPIQILNSIHRPPGFRVPALTTDGLVVLGGLVNSGWLWVQVCDQDDQH